MHMWTGVCVCICTETRIGCQIAPPITLHLVLGGRPFPKCVTLISTSPIPKSPAPSLYISVELGLQVFQMHFNLFCVSWDPNSSSHDCGARTLNHRAIILAPCALFFLCKTGYQQHLTPRLAELHAVFIADTFIAFMKNFSSMDSLIPTTQGDQYTLLLKSGFHSLALHHCTHEPRMVGHTFHSST